MADLTTVLFGGIIARLTTEELRCCRNVLRSKPTFTPLIAVLDNLPSTFNTLLQEFDDFDQRELSKKQRHIPAAISEWIRHGSLESLETLKSCAMGRAVLSVIFHITAYVGYLDSQPDGGDAHVSVRSAVSKQGGYQGLCIGLLSAAAVASAPSYAELGQNAAIAARLAFSIGLYTDLDVLRCQDADLTPRTFAVRWSDDRSLDDIRIVLKSECPNVSLNIQYFCVRMLMKV